MIYTWIKRTPLKQEQTNALLWTGPVAVYLDAILSLALLSDFTGILTKSLE